MESVEGKLFFLVCPCALWHYQCVKATQNYQVIMHRCLSKFSFQGADGVLVPGGFGDRGVQGKILAAKHARENNIPFLGICLGMQTAVIEYCRSVLNLHDANSTEFDPDTTNPCVIFMPEVRRVKFQIIIILMPYNCAA